uniref:Uncharacterized protein n=1 Tax=Phasianus colchicus TaxID=9054 RepID=A0A669Q7A7_PHACC
MPCTTTRTSAVPDLGGEPPSTAVSTKCSSRCSSRSKALSRTSSASGSCRFNKIQYHLLV